VSRVLNNVSKGFSVSPEKRKFIMQTASQMGYVPNQAARNLRLNRTNRIMVYGLSVGWGIHETTYAQMLISCVNRLNEAGFEVDVAYPANREQMFSRMAFDGAVIINPGFSSLINDIKKLRVPYVIMNDCPPLKECSCVTVDDVDGMNQAIAYLNSKGHTRIAYRCSHHSEEEQSSHKSIPERYHTYFNGIKKLGSQPFSDYAKSFSEHEFLAEIKRRNITAVITYDISCAMELMKQCSKDNIKIPEELSFISFNEPVYPTFPELCTIRLPLGLMGSAAADILIDNISNGGKNRQQIFKETLVEGQSVADNKL
jgi:LacI family transcriptional regulator